MSAVGWSGFYGDDATHSGSYSLVDGKMPRRDRIKRVVNREGFRPFTALFGGLVGAATGSNVTATHSRVSAPAPQGDMGGLRSIDTITDINRNTVAGDVTALKEMVFNVKSRPSTYPKDLSGNGGPAF